MCVQSALFRFHNSVLAGRIVLKVSQGLAIDLLSLLQVKKMILNNDIAMSVARRLAWHQVRLVSPVTWHGWGLLFIDAYFAAARDASQATARAMMYRWRQVHRELVVFFDFLLL